MPILPIFTQKRYQTTFWQKNLLKGLLIVLFLFLIPKIGLAATIFEDDFNSYSNGDLNGQGSWTKNSGTLNVQDNVVFEGAKAITGLGNYQKTGSELTAGSLTYYYFYSGTAGDWKVWLKKDGAGIIRTEFNNDLKFYYYAPTKTLYGSYLKNVWNRVDIEWRIDPTDKARYRLNEGSWTDWVVKFAAGSLNYLQITSENEANQYFDYIAEGGYLPPCDTYENQEDCENAGYCYWWEKLDACLDEEEITQTWIYPEIPNPNDEIETYTTSTDLILKGQIKIGYEDGFKWAYTDFYAYFTNLITGKNYTFHKELEETTPNEIIDYEENLGVISEFLTDWEQGNFRVDYALLGKDYLQFWIRNWVMVGDGVIAVSEIIELPFEVVEIPEIELDDCEELSGVEKWLCEIKNMWKGIFYPTSSKISELKYNIELLSEKAPINYLNETKDFISDVKDEITTTETDFKILGESGTLTFAGLDFDVENGEGTENFISFLRKFFTFILLFGLLIWSIKFIRKFWK